GQIASRLDDRFRLLTGGSRAALPRQQTLRALIDWSYDLLSDEERTLLCRLSVFAGGWTLEAAEAVCADVRDEEREMRDEGGEPPSLFLISHSSSLIPDAVIDLLTALEEKSLVLVEATALGLRNQMLETVREYARAKL